MALANVLGIVRTHRAVPFCLATLVILPGVLMLVSSTQAEQYTFTLDQSKSVLTVSGGWGEFSFEPQDVAPGGDTAHYTGTILVDVDNLLAPTQIQFVQALMLADVTGDWLPAIGGGDEGDPGVEGDAQPGEPAPGNYGLLLDAGDIGRALGAFRDLGLSISSDPQLVANGTFNDGQIVTVAQGTWESNVQSVLLGDDANVDDVTDTDPTQNFETGSYTVEDDGARITLPIMLEFSGSQVFIFEGTIVATASLKPPVPGDFDDNGTLDVADINKLTQQVILGTNDLNFDLNADNLVNGSDRTVWVKDLRQTWFGDADLNGAFDSNDFVQVFSVGKYETSTSAGWEEGDWDGNGVFDSGDFVRAFQDGGYELAPAAAAATVPEPATISLVLLAVTGLLLRRRRR